MAKKRSFFRTLLLPVRRRGGTFAHDERGVTIIEFGILAVPFFALIGATLETAVVFLGSQFLDSAVQDSARLIRTGQAQGAGFTATNFRTAICDGLYGLFDCTQLKIKVSVVTNFANATVTSPIQPAVDCTTACNWTIVEQYNPGVGSDVILVQAYYKWPVMLNFAGFNLMDQPDGKRMLGAVRVFRNEPF